MVVRIYDKGGRKGGDVGVKERWRERKEVEGENVVWVWLRYYGLVGVEVKE